MRGDTAVEKGVDVTLATDLLRMGWMNLYDVAVLVSGDGDFAYALQAVKDMGKHVEVAAFQANLAWELSQVADRSEMFTPAFFEELWSRRRQPQPEAQSTGQKRRWGFGRSPNGDAR